MPPLLFPHYLSTTHPFTSLLHQQLNQSPSTYAINIIVMFAARRFATNVPRVRAQASLFHSTAPAFVQKGDAIPNLDVLVENSPGNKVNLAKEIKNKAVIIGTPAAFSA